MNGTFHALMLAAPSSGSGKTTLTLALLRLLARRGLAVQPFKCGPDYLDTRLHAIAASLGGSGRPGINLDTFMAGKAHVQELFARHAGTADVAVAEGVMGLFDGAERSRGSSAEIAALLELPVVMVIDARSMAYSAAPLLQGFKSFDARVRVVGAIFNRVGSPSHYRYLEEAARDVGVEPLGFVPPSDAITISERHLGLNTSASYDRDKLIDAMADHIEQTVDLERLLAIAAIPRPAAALRSKRTAAAQRTIAVARDEAFNFLYGENLSVLEEHGRIEWFSPMEDARLPEADLLYLAGGYPELYAAELAANGAMRGAIAEYCRKGGRAYAECGGLMYLGNAITLQDGSSWPMCGVLDLSTTMEESRLTLGYRTLRLREGYGRELRGHEFHYSRIAEQGGLHSIAEPRNARGEPCPSGFYRQGNTIASYLHLYWGETRDFPEWLLSMA